jgi:hypothetical protein
MAFICDWRRFAKNLKQLNYMNAMRNQLLLLLASFAFGVSAAMAQ